MNKAKVFINGHSQAVRIPNKFKFKTKEVICFQLGESLVLQPYPKTWKDIFKDLSLISTGDFLMQREDLSPQGREGLI